MDFDILVPLAGIFFGGMIILIPVAGFTVRLALKPMVESWVRMRETPLTDERLQVMERRVSLLESQIESLERDNLRLTEEHDFRLKLGLGDR